MKKVMVAFLLLVGVSSFAAAQGVPTIGIYEDVDYTICYGDVEVYVAHDVFVVANLTPEIPGITAVEFRVDNLPEENPALGIRTDSWTSTLVIGDLGYDIAIAWDSMQPGPWVLIGTLSFFMIDPTWIGADHLMTVAPGLTCDCLVVVDDVFEEHDADGGWFTFNCSNPTDCLCFDDLTATEDASWGTIKALY